MYCRTKYNLSRGDVELCPTSTDFVEWRLTRNISICIMVIFVELRASKNIICPTSKINHFATREIEQFALALCISF